MTDSLTMENQRSGLFLLSILTAAMFAGYLAFVDHAAFWAVVAVFGVLVLVDVYVGVTLNHAR